MTAVDARPEARQASIWFLTGTAVAGLFVAGIVSSVGYAIDEWQGFGWALGGAVAWATAFALGAHELGRPVRTWALAGGLACGIGWALAWPMAMTLEVYQLRHSHSGALTPSWGFVWGVPAGLGGGLLGGVALARRGTVLGLVIGASLGFLAGLSLVLAPLPFAGSRPATLALAVLGAVLGVPIGLRIGRWVRPTLFVFEDLWPYLREMMIPFAGFVAGYLLLVVAFAGFYGSLWRVSRGAFSGLPAEVDFLDFVYASIGIATGTSNDLSPATPLAKMAVSTEAVFAQGWLIAVFAAVGAHLSPRFSRLAEGSQGPTAAAPTAPTPPPGPDKPLVVASTAPRRRRKR